MIVVSSRREVRSEIASARRSGQTVALVPTMGYLHEGHLSLVDLARSHADLVALSLFVNPLQFGPSEDLDAYPRNLDRDLALAAERGVDLTFAPSDTEMYPEGEPRITVDPGPMADRLCGAFRPGHFRGVLTVVAKLFSLFTPDRAVFGRKDFQQSVLIRRMVRDLEMGVEVVTGPTVRETDGLAMSSRNARLSAEGREWATALHRALSEAQKAFAKGVHEREALLGSVSSILDDASDVTTQYTDLVDPGTLDPVGSAEVGSVVAIAAFVEGVRLIDNIELLGGEPV